MKIKKNTFAFVTQDPSSDNFSVNNEEVRFRLIKFNIFQRK